MPAPTNISEATAIDLGSFPVTYTQNVNDSGTTFTVFTKFTATQTGVVSLWARGVIGGGVTDYIAHLFSEIGPVGAPTPWPPNVGTANNVPMQIPVTTGVTYYQGISSVHGNVATANLTLEAEYFTQTTATVGSLCVPDDTAGFPMSIFSPSTGAMRHFVLDFPPGEQGVSEPSIGAILVDDNENKRFTLYTSSISEVATLAHPTATGTLNNRDLAINFGRTVPSFYAGWISSGTTMALRQLSVSDLTQLATWTLASVHLVRALAPNHAQTVLYLSGKAGGVESAISKYDLVGNVFLADFVATVAGYTAEDILVLSNDTVVISYFKATATLDLLIKTYDNTGAVLHSKSYGSALLTSTPSRLTYALDDPTSFWLMQQNSDRTATIRNVKVSDLTDIVSFTIPDFEFGVYEPAQTSSPERFGHSESCPIFVLRGAITMTQTLLLRRQRRFLLPSSDNNYTMQIPIIELLMRTGIGLKPDGLWSGTTPYGTDPLVRIRLSKDGGKTWGPETRLPAGRRGEYLDRVRLLQATGNYRNAVLEVTVDAPVDWQWIAAMGNPVEGSS